MHTYKLFNYNILSEKKFPSFPPHRFKTPHVRLVWRSVPDELPPERVLSAGPFWQRSPNHTLVRTEIGNFLIRSNNEIRIDPVMSAPFPVIQRMLFASVFSVLLNNLGVFSLHASAVAHNGFAVAFTGKSGAGKSTTASVLFNRGYSVITDDICPISTPGDTPEVLPGSPWVHLHKTAADTCFTGTGFDSHPIDRGKIQIDLPDHGAQVPLKLLYLLGEPDDLRPEEGIYPLTGKELVRILDLNTHRRVYLRQGLGQQANHFHTCVSIAEKIQGFQWIRSKTSGMGPPVDHLEAHFRGLLGDGGNPAP